MMRPIGPKRSFALAASLLALLICCSNVSANEYSFNGKGSKAAFDRAATFDTQATNLHFAGKNKEAVECRKKAIAIYPYEPAFYNNQGLDYSELKDFTNSCKNYRRAIELLPTFGEAWVNLSDDLYLMKDYVGAEQAALKAVRFRAASCTSWTNLAQAELALKKVALAKQHIAKAKQMPNAAEYSGDIGKVELDLKNSETK